MEQPEKRIGYIYALYDPRHHDIFRYIGQTRNIKKRISDHISTSKNENNRIKKAVWIRSLLKEGIVPEIIVIEESIISVLGEREKFWILYYRLLNQADTNYKFGGGCCDKPRTLLSKKRMSVKMDEYYVARGGKSIGQKKKELLSFKTGFARPRQKELLSALKNYTGKSNSGYDETFDIKIRKRHPNWFINQIKNDIIERKKILLLLPLESKRPKGKLLTTVILSCRENGKCYDKNFDIAIRKRFPYWFGANHRNQEILNTKNYFLNLPPNSRKISPRTFLGGAFVRYTTISRAGGFDKDFKNAMLLKQPHWFITPKMIVENKKQMLINYPENSPKLEKNTKLYKSFYSYTTKSDKNNYDEIFDKKMRLRQPEWFLNRRVK